MNLSSLLEMPPAHSSNGGNVTVAPPDVSDTQSATFGLTGVFLFLTVGVVIVAVRQRCRKNRLKSRGDEEEEEPEDPRDTRKAADHYGQPAFISGTMDRNTEADRWNHLADDLRWMLKNHMIERSRVRLGKVIGKGEFGCVYEATLDPSTSKSNDYLCMTSQKVAAKTLKGLNLTVDCVESFLREGITMKDFNHRNVLSLVGVAIDDGGIPLILVPFMARGCLKRYIVDSANELTVRALLTFGHQIAEGMKYLSQLKFVHRDLATRNCMLDENLVIKVGDFGLSRDIYCSDYYTSSNRFAKLPIRWMAPESFSSARYTIKSDVWSFGVVLWELLTRGTLPYTDVSNWDVKPFILSGQRMSQPEVCPDEVYEIMLQCWSREDTKRPSFASICNFLDSLLNEDSISNEGKEDNDYVNLLLNVDVEQNDIENAKQDEKFHLLQHPTSPSTTAGDASEH